MPKETNKPFPDFPPPHLTDETGVVDMAEKEYQDFLAFGGLPMKKPKKPNPRTKSHFPKSK